MKRKFNQALNKVLHDGSSWLLKIIFDSLKN